MYRILIVDSHSSANRGDAAILQSLIDSLRQQIPDATFKVHSTYPHIATAMHYVAASHPLIRRPHGAIAYGLTLGKIALFFLLACGHRYGVDMIRYLPRHRLLAIYRDFLEADLIVGMGGGFYNDNYRHSLPGRLFHLLLGKILRKPVVISAHSIGPFRYPLYRWLAHFTFRQLDLICLRDEESLAHLDFCYLDRSRVKVVADSAWLMKASTPGRARQILALENVPLGKSLVSVALIRWPFYKMKSVAEGHQHYLAAVAEVVSRLIKEFDCHVVFLSTNTSLGGHPTDDRRTAQEVQALLEPSLLAQTTRIGGEYLPQEIKALYGEMTLHIGTRMHSVILAAAMETPVVGIAYEFKMVGVMRALGLAAYVTDIETIQASDFWLKVEAAWDKKEAITESIAESLTVLKSLAMENARLIAAVACTFAQEDKNG
ncbi:MAG: polysaccharide pyruvyl transferase family protein [Anaerolineae bacterium]|nr:polysaccharide pyruvyl transferase family protein [Anaerolineae bacterium]